MIGFLSADGWLYRLAYGRDYALTFQQLQQKHLERHPLLQLPMPPFYLSTLSVTAVPFFSRFGRPWFGP